MGINDNDLAMERSLYLEQMKKNNMNENFVAIANEALQEYHTTATFSGFPTQAEERVAEFEYRLNSLRACNDLQKKKGNYDFDAYMHGLHVGLEMATAILEGREPEYNEQPKKFLRDKKKK